jgi:hypothetical protein
MEFGHKFVLKRMPVFSKHRYCRNFGDKDCRGLSLYNQNVFYKYCDHKPFFFIISIYSNDLVELINHQQFYIYHTFNVPAKCSWEDFN